MPDELRIERTDGVGLLLTSEGDGIVWVEPQDENPENCAKIDAADLHWLVTTGGPAMIALLGGPLAIKAGHSADV